MQRHYETKKIEGQLRQAAIVFESAAEGVIVTDYNFRISQVNRTFSKLTGYPQNEILNCKNESLYAKIVDCEIFVNQITQPIQECKKWRGEIWYKREDGTKFPA